MSLSQLHRFREPLSWLVLALILFWLWDTRILFPLKIFVVFLHEISHALAAWLSGGSLVELAIDANQSGHAVTRGGSRFLILSAGYIGSMLWGGALMLAATYSKHDKAISVAIGAATILITLFYVRSLFGFVFGICFGIALIAAGRYLLMEANEVILEIIGFCSCIYAALDIKSDVLDRSYMRSDARMLAELTGIPTLVWGTIWFALSLVLGTYILYLCSKHKKEIHR